MSKNYYIITSEATFSAANLLASLVKDNVLAIVIGDDSLGGACALGLTVLPNGSIITNSSNNSFTNKDGLLIEDGIEPDIYLVDPIDDLTFPESVVSIINQNK